jgi:CBS domain-containing membrane protein
MIPKYVRDLMTSDVVTLKASDELGAFRDILYERGFRHVPVVDEDGNLIGIVTERDFLRNVLTDQADIPISVRDEVMRSTQIGDIMIQDVVTVEPDDLLPGAAQVMLDNKFGCLPVTDGPLLVGILTESDFIRFFTQA